MSLRDLTPPVMAVWLIEAWRELNPCMAIGEPAIWLGPAERLIQRISGRVMDEGGPDRQWRLSPGDLVQLCRAMGQDPGQITLADFLARLLPPAQEVPGPAESEDVQ